MVAGLPRQQHVNSLGNLAVDDEAALLFTDYASGATVQATGTARVQWAEDGRRVEFSVGSVVTSAD